MSRVPIGLTLHVSSLKNKSFSTFSCQIFYIRWAVDSYEFLNPGLETQESPLAGNLREKKVRG